MVARDVIANILDRFTKGGITHSFSHDDLIVRVTTYARSLDGLENDLLRQITDVVKMLKDEYKGVTGRALPIGEVESQDFNVVSNYTTNKLSLVTLSCVYELPEEEKNTDDDAALEKADLRSNIPNVNPKNK